MNTSTSMFKGKTAWFSKSVGEDVISFWVSEGGALSSWRTANYLFSDDASSNDTKRIFDSEDYEQNRATVFHSKFLCACKPRKSVTSVPIGHYVLPPESVQNEVRALTGKFIWENDEQVGEQVMGEKQINPKVPKYTLSGETGDHPEREKNSQEHFQTVASPNKVSSCCEVQQYPVNNMISGYAHADQMKMYLGELEDFLPSLHGYNVSRSNEAAALFHHKAI